jgi:two-component system, OmpR family, KDP operon response regulator KdpE
VTDPADSGPPLRILSVDDDPGNQSLIRAILARAVDFRIRAARVIEATTLAEARAILDRDEVDVVLLDIHLPDGIGLDLAAELRARHAGRTAGRPALLALTASVLPADQQAALDAGCDAFLAKPYAAGELVSTVRQLVDDLANESSSGS